MATNPSIPNMVSLQLALLLSLVIRSEAASFLLISNIELFDLFNVAEPPSIQQTFISCKFQYLPLLLKYWHLVSICPKPSNQRLVTLQYQADSGELSLPSSCSYDWKPETPSNIRLHQQYKCADSAYSWAFGQYSDSSAFALVLYHRYVIHLTVLNAATKRGNHDRAIAT